MQFAWLLTAFTATLSCMATGATAAETDAAAEAAALAIAKKLYPTCAVSFGTSDRCDTPPFGPV